MIMRREILKVKNKKLIPNSFYRTWKMYDGLEKGVRMREMSKKEVMIEALYRIVDKLQPNKFGINERHLETFVDLAKIYKRLEHTFTKEAYGSDEMNAISEVVGSYCHVCGNNCRMVTDEKHGEDFIICNGEWDSTVSSSKIRCENYGMETEGIEYFVRRLKVDV